MANVADAAAIQAIYAPIVEGTAISFEEVPPSIAEMGERIATTLGNYPYLIAERSVRSSDTPMPASIDPAPPIGGQSMSRSTSPIRPTGRGSDAPSIQG
jgi:hypothetical protein